MGKGLRNSPCRELTLFSAFTADYVVQIVVEGHWADHMHTVPILYSKSEEKEQVDFLSQ